MLHASQNDFSKFNVSYLARNKSSPYVHPLVHYLQQAGHLVSVILPHQQRSWIGKAHFVGQLTKPTYFHPGTIHEDDGTTHEKPSSDANHEEWVLVDGTPATCAQLGLHHFFQDRPPIDIVVSGPNYGRNSTSLFSLSSGTIGGAMEAAVFRKRAVALSFAFWSRDHDAAVIADACKHSIRLIEYLATHWGRDVDLYSINVPLVENVGENKVLYTHALQNYWRSGSSFEEVEAEDLGNPDEREEEIREKGEGDRGDSKTSVGHGENSSKPKHKWFRWAPKFSDVQKSVDASEPGNDGWAINKGYTR